MPRTRDELEQVMGSFRERVGQIGELLDQQFRERAGDVLPSGIARAELGKTLRRFREAGADAEPVFLGSHRKPEAVLLSFEKYEQLLDHLDELVLALRLRDRPMDEGSEILELKEFLRNEGLASALGLPGSSSDVAHDQHEEGGSRSSLAAFDRIEAERR